MGKVGSLVLKISLGIFAATNFLVLMITTDVKVLVIANIAVAIICISIFALIEARIATLSTDFGISKNAARELAGAYFVYYKNVEKISIDEFRELSLSAGNHSRDEC